MGVRPALEHSNVALLTNAKVVRLGTDASGRTVTDVPRRAARRDEARAALVARAGRAARDRLLARDGGPAARREPGHRRPRREAHPRLPADERGVEAAALRAAQVDAREAADGARSS